jgi:glycosyltransferase involved in cell wall biosynthesis
MALGKAVIASDVGGIPDLVINNHNGLLFPPADVERLTDNMNILLNDPGKRKQMGDRGKVVAAAYSAEAMVQKIARLYDEVLPSIGARVH